MSASRSVGVSPAVHGEPMESADAPSRDFSWADAGETPTLLELYHSQSALRRLHSFLPDLDARHYRQKGNHALNLHYKITRPDQLGVDSITEMHALFEACYDCAPKSAFDADLADKTHVVLLLDETQRLMGFSTQQIYQIKTADGPANILFSGDTEIAQSCWGTQKLVRGWCEVAARMVANAGEVPCYWFLISKGFRTYLYLPLFFKVYHPHPDGHGAKLKPLLDQLADEKFHDAYHPATGLIRFSSSQGQLGDRLADVPYHRHQDRDVQFFLSRNPDYASGVELACLAPITLANTYGIGRRILTQALKCLP